MEIMCAIGGAHDRSRTVDRKRNGCGQSDIVPIAKATGPKFYNRAPPTGISRTSLGNAICCTAAKLRITRSTANQRPLSGPEDATIRANCRSEAELTRATTAGCNGWLDEQPDLPDAAFFHQCVCNRCVA
jgi:hypothetical protein